MTVRISKVSEQEVCCAKRRQFMQIGLAGLGVVGVGMLGVAFPFSSASAQNNANIKSDGLSALDYFLNHVDSLRANFVQVVTSPNNDRTRTSSGTFLLSRPNKFRFNYIKPYEQQIISDGVDFWLYDKDLEQVTQRVYSSAISGTPAALLAGGAQATMMQQNFTLSNLPEEDGLLWVLAKPKQEDGQINVARIGFRDGTLAVLEITDNFRQKSTLTFSNVQTNVAIAESEFKFDVPSGVDLIHE